MASHENLKAKITFWCLIKQTDSFILSYIQNVATQSFYKSVVNWVIYKELLSVISWRLLPYILWNECYLSIDNIFKSLHQVPIISLTPKSSEVRSFVIAHYRYFKANMFRFPSITQEISWKYAKWINNSKRGTLGHTYWNYGYYLNPISSLINGTSLTKGNESFYNQGLISTAVTIVSGIHYWCYRRTGRWYEI
jgi:hypothetical protein